MGVETSHFFQKFPSKLSLIATVNLILGAMKNIFHPYKLYRNFVVIVFIFIILAEPYVGITPGCAASGLV